MSTINLHDLATILLHERLLTEPRFRCSRLREVNDESTRPKSLPSHVPLALRPMNIPHTAYFLSDEGNEDAEIIEPATFRHENLTTTLELSDSEVELAFWRCKHHDSGYIMAYAMQLILDALPDTTKLCIRTSRGYALATSARNFAIAELSIMARSVTYICKITKQPHLGPTKVDMEQHLTGAQGWFPWVYMLFGGEEVGSAEPQEDGRVALDLVSPMLGLRGLGGEVFIMERMEEMHTKLLPRAAFEGDPLTLSGRILPIHGRRCVDEGTALSARVLARLARIKSGEELFCAYCGKDTPKSQCAACHNARYCDKGCQLKAWKYHKAWCKNDLEP